MRIFFIIFTILYVLLEIAFRARLLDTISVVSNYSDIESIETIGRVISSLGFAMLMISYFKYGKTIGKKILSNISIFVISFLFFYIGQSILINQVVKSIDDKTKKTTILLSEYKEDLYYSLLSEDPNNISSQDKIYLAANPFLYLKNENLIDHLEKNSNEIFAANIGFKLKFNSYHDEFKKWQNESVVLQDLWIEYQSYSNRVSNAKNKGIDKWEFLKKFNRHKDWGDFIFYNYRKVVLGLFTHNYIGDYAYYTYNGTRIVSSSGNRPHLDITPVASLIGIKSLYDLSETTYDSKSELLKHLNMGFRKITTHNVKNQLDEANRFLRYLEYKEKPYDDFLSKYEEMVYPLSENICYESNTIPELGDRDNKKKIDKIKKGEAVVIYRDLNNFEVVEYLDIDFKLDKEYLFCDTGRVARKLHKSLVFVANHINKNYFGLNKDYNLLNDSYYNVPFFKKAIKLRYSNNGWDVPLGHKYYDKNEFARYYKKAEEGKLQRSLDNKISKLADMRVDHYVEKYGHAKLGLSEPQFYNIAGVDLFIKREFPYLFKQDGRWNIYYSKESYNFIHSKNESEIINLYMDRKYKYIGEYKYDIYSSQKEDTELLDKFTKVTMVPVIILLISTIVIFLNVANLIIIIFDLKDPKKKILVYGGMILLILSLCFVDNRVDLDESDTKIVESLNTSSILLLNFLKNSEYILEVFGVFNEQMFIVIDEFDNLFVDKIK